MIAQMFKMQKSKLAPGVKEEMLNPEFWIKCEEKKVIMNKKEIGEFNQLVYKKARQKEKEEEFCDLKNYPSKISKKELYDLMKDYSLPEKLKEMS